MGLQVKDLGAQEASENILAPLSLVPIKDTGLCSHGHLASPHHPLSCQFGGAWPGAIFVPYLRRREPATPTFLSIFLLHRAAVKCLQLTWLSISHASNPLLREPLFGLCYLRLTCYVHLFTA